MSNTWTDGALALAGKLPVDVLDADAVAALRSVRPHDAPLAVACSAGADSLTALLLTWAHFPKRRQRLLALNFNHRTRAECAEDARFVREVASALGVAFVAGELVKKDAAGNAAGNAAGGDEAFWRERRLTFFRNACRKHGAAQLVQGHHAGDVVETVLMRLARGAGSDALCAPRPVQNFTGGLTVIRPLLTLEKSRITGALRDAALPWREDETNAGDTHLRNRLRHAVIPAWEEAQGRGITAGVVRSRRLLAEDDAALDVWLDSVWCRVAIRPDIYDWTPLAALPAALHRRALRRVTLAVARDLVLLPALADELTAALAAGTPFQKSLSPAISLRFDAARAKLLVEHH